MKVRPEWAHLVQGSKVGVGTQGQCDLNQLDRTVDRVLVLDPDLSHYLLRFGARGWLRIMHDDDNWKGWTSYAQHCAIRMSEAYQHGCRDLIPVNEQIALEGLGQSVEDYRWLGQVWGPRFMEALRYELSKRGMADVRVWGPALSPGHQEDDGFQGYRELVPWLSQLDGIAVHNYWLPGAGFIGNEDFQWWAGRIERAHSLLVSLGIDLPYAVTEFNRKVNRGNMADIALYADECKQYYRWLNSLDYVVAAFTFLYCNTDPGFSDLTWVQMPGMTERMSDGWDRQTEGEWATPVPQQPDIPRFLMGFADYAAGRDWIALESERPDWQGNSYQRFVNALGAEGLMRWDKEANAITVYWEE